MFNSEIANEIASYIGNEATLVLCTHLAGLPIYIPKSKKPSDFLINIIGEEAAAKLHEVYSGECLDLPVLRTYHTKKTHGLILKDKESGLSYRELAIKYRYHLRSIFYIFARSKNQHTANLTFEF